MNNMKLEILIEGTLSALQTAFNQWTEHNKNCSIYHADFTVLPSKQYCITIFYSVYTPK